METLMTMAVESRNTVTFKEAYCHYFKCPPEEFEREALPRCLYPHARVWASWVRRISPQFFETDFKIIQSLGEATSIKEVRAEASYLHDNYSKHEFRRDWLYFRISGKLMLRLANRFLAEDRRDKQFYRKTKSPSD